MPEKGLSPRTLLILMTSISLLYLLVIVILLSCHHQIKQLEGWFKAAEAIRYTTGQGSLDTDQPPDGLTSDVGLFEFNVATAKVNNIKFSKRRGAKKLIGDGSLQSKSLMVRVAVVSDNDLSASF